MKWKGKVSIWMILLIIGMTFYSSMVFAEYNDAGVELVTGFSVAGEEYKVKETKKLKIKNAGESCEDKEGKTSAFVETMDSGIISTLEKIAATMFMICTVWDAFKTAYSIAGHLGYEQDLTCKVQIPWLKWICGVNWMVEQSEIGGEFIFDQICHYVNCKWKDWCNLPVPVPLSGGQSVSALGPFDNIYTAIGCLCPVAVLYNLRKLKTIYQVYDCCVEQACENGMSTEGCERQLSEATCMFWKGALAMMLVNLLMSIMAKLIAEHILKPIIKKVLESKFSPLITLIEIGFEAYGIYTSMMTAIDWFSKAFSDPECGDLGFEDLKKEMKSKAVNQPERRLQDTDGDGMMDSSRKIDAKTAQQGEYPAKMKVEKGDKVRRIETYDKETGDTNTYYKVRSQGDPKYFGLVRQNEYQYYDAEGNPVTEADYKKDYKDSVGGHQRQKLEAQRSVKHTVDFGGDKCEGCTVTKIDEAPAGGKDGYIITYKDSSGKEKKYDSASAGQRDPIVTLPSGHTAKASEIQFSDDGKQMTITRTEKVPEKTDKKFRIWPLKKKEDSKTEDAKTKTVTTTTTINTVTGVEWSQEGKDGPINVKVTGDDGKVATVQIKDKAHVNTVTSMVKSGAIDANEMQVSKIELDKDGSATIELKGDRTLKYDGKSTVTETQKRPVSVGAGREETLKTTRTVNLESGKTEWTLQQGSNKEVKIDASVAAQLKIQPKDIKHVSSDGTVTYDAPGYGDGSMTVTDGTGGDVTYTIFAKEGAKQEDLERKITTRPMGKDGKDGTQVEDVSFKDGKKQSKTVTSTYPGKDGAEPVVVEQKQVAKDGKLGDASVTVISGKETMEVKPEMLESKNLESVKADDARHLLNVKNELGTDNFQHSDTNPTTGETSYTTKSGEKDTSWKEIKIGQNARGEPVANKQEMKKIGEKTYVTSDVQTVDGRRTSETNTDYDSKGNMEGSKTVNFEVNQDGQNRVANVEITNKDGRTFTYEDGAVDFQTSSPALEAKRAELDRAYTEKGEDITQLMTELDKNPDDPTLLAKKEAAEREYDEIKEQKDALGGVKLKKGPGGEMVIVGQEGKMKFDKDGTLLVKPDGADGYIAYTKHQKTLSGQTTKMQEAYDGAVQERKDTMQQVETLSQSRDDTQTRLSESQGEIDSILDRTDANSDTLYGALGDEGIENLGSNDPAKIESELNKLKEARGSAIEEKRAIEQRAEAEGRGLTEAEQSEVDSAQRIIEATDPESVGVIESAEKKLETARELEDTKTKLGEAEKRSEALKGKEDAAKTALDEAKKTEGEAADAAASVGAEDGKNDDIEAAADAMEEGQEATKEGDAEETETEEGDEPEAKSEKELANEQRASQLGYQMAMMLLNKLLGEAAYNMVFEAMCKEDYEASESIQDEPIDAAGVGCVDGKSQATGQFRKSGNNYHYSFAIAACGQRVHYKVTMEGDASNFIEEWTLPNGETTSKKGVSFFNNELNRLCIVTDDPNIGGPCFT